jgi:hypothetical protein
VDLDFFHLCFGIVILDSPPQNPNACELRDWFCDRFRFVALLTFLHFGKLANKRYVQIEPVKSAIGIMEYQFTGGLELDGDGKLYRVNTTKTQYVGLPNREIDKAWDALIAGKWNRSALWKLLTLFRVRDCGKW